MQHSTTLLATFFFPFKFDYPPPPPPPIPSLVEQGTVSEHVVAAGFYIIEFGLFFFFFICFFFERWTSISTSKRGRGETDTGAGSGSRE